MRELHFICALGAAAERTLADDGGSEGLEVPIARLGPAGLELLTFQRRVVMQEVAQRRLAIGRVPLCVQDVHVPEFVDLESRRGWQFGVQAAEQQKAAVLALDADDLITSPARIHELDADPAEVEAGNLLFELGTIRDSTNERASRTCDRAGAGRS